MNTVADKAPAEVPSIALRATDLSKSYGSQWALRGVDLEVRAGEAIALFGANGAGKSTLIRTLATLITPSHGSVWIAGYEASRHARLVREALGVLGHQSYLHSELTSEENLALYAELYGLEDAEVRVRESLASVDLTAAANKRVRELSRGMEQRLALARATLHTPAVLLLDEPDSSLDVDGLNCLERLLARGRERGQAVVLATHRMELGLRLCSRALILSRGRIAHQAQVGAHTLDQWRVIYDETSAPGRRLGIRGDKVQHRESVGQ